MTFDQWNMGIATLPMISERKKMFALSSDLNANYHRTPLFQLGHCCTAARLELQTASGLTDPEGLESSFKANLEASFWWSHKKWGKHMCNEKKWHPPSIPITTNHYCPFVSLICSHMVHQTQSMKSAFTGVFPPRLAKPQRKDWKKRRSTWAAQVLNGPQ